MIQLASGAVERLTWHDPRHTFAGRPVMAGGGLRAIQEALGHTSIAIAVPYSHLSPDYQLAAVERLVPKASGVASESRTDTTTSTRPFAAAEPRLVHRQ